MSIYSGFPTRKDETNYNNLLYKLISTLQNHLLQLVQAHGLPFNRTNTYEKIIHKMRQFEEHKYLQPKFSDILEPLAKFIGMPEKLDIIPEHTFSRMYVSTTKDKQKGDTSHSHSVFSSKKGSQGVTAHEVDGRSNEGKSMENLWQTKTKLNVRYRNERDPRNSRTTPKKANFHQSFYAIHEKKLSKMNQMYGRKSRDATKLKETDIQSAKIFKHPRSFTEAEEQNHHRNSRQFCIDLKILKEAQRELRKAEHQDKYYLIPEEPAFDT